MSGEGPVVRLDKPGATISGATLRGVRVEVLVDGAVMKNCDLAAGSFVVGPGRWNMRRLLRAWIKAVRT